MAKLMTVFRHEWTLLWRGKAAPALLGAFAVFWLFTIVRFEADPNGRGLRGDAFYNQLYPASMAVMLMCSLAAAHRVEKERTGGMQPMSLSWEVSNGAWLGGKWLALQAYGQLFTLVGAVAQLGWFAAAGSASLRQWPVHLAFTSLQLGCGLVFMISLGFTAAVVLRGRVVYLLLPLLWMCPLFIENEGHSGTPALETIWRWFSPYGLTGYKVFPFRNVWEIPHLLPVVQHQLPLALASLGLFVLGVAAFERYRNGPRETRTYRLAAFVAGTVSVIVISVGFAGFSGRIDRQREQMDRYLTQGQSHEKLYEKAVPDTDFVPARYDLTVGFPGRDAIAATAVVTVVQQRSESSSVVDFTLNRSIRVVSVVTDRPATWSRDGDFVAIRTEQPIRRGETMKLTFVYEGEIDEYREEGLLKYSFASKTMLNLPKSVAWYPLIGKRQLIRAADHNNTAIGYIAVNGIYVEPAPASYLVSLEGGAYPHAVMPIVRTSPGRYEGTSDYGLFLAAGVIAEKDVEGVRVVDHPDMLAATAEEVRRTMERQKFIEAWLGDKADIPSLWTTIFTSHEGDWLYDGSDVRWAYMGANAPRVEGGDDLGDMVNWLVSWCYGKRFDIDYVMSFDRFESFYLRLNGKQPTNKQSRFLELIAEAERQGGANLERMAGTLYKAFKSAEQSNTFDPVETWQRIGKGGAS